MERLHIVEWDWVLTVLILNHSSSLRDVIAFPKNASAVCPMSEAPTIVDQKQLDELGIKIVKKEGNDMQ